MSEIIHFEDRGAMRYEWMHFAVSLTGPKITSSISLHSCCPQITYPAMLEVLKGRCRSTSHQMPNPWGLGLFPFPTGQPQPRRQPARGHNLPLPPDCTAKAEQRLWAGSGRGRQRHFQISAMVDARQEDPEQVQPQPQAGGGTTHYCQWQVHTVKPWRKINWIWPQLQYGKCFATW